MAAHPPTRGKQGNNREGVKGNGARRRSNPLQRRGTRCSFGCNLPNNGKKPGQTRWESVLADSAADERDESVSSYLRAHSITSSARASSVGGTSRPSARAVCMLITNSNLVGCTTGRLAGLAPLRI